jgi:hypothetical protein
MVAPGPLAEYAASAQHPLADLGQFANHVLVLVGELASKSSLTRRAGLGSPARQLSHVFLVVRVSERALQLDQQRIEGDAELQGRLPHASRVEIGTGAEQQRLADIEVLAAAEHGRHPALRAQLVGPLSPSGTLSRTDLDVVCLAEAPRCDLLAAAISDSDRHRLPRTRFPDVWIGARHRLGVQRSAEQRDRLVGQGIGGLVPDRLPQPGLCPLRRVEAFHRAHDRDLGERQRDLVPAVPGGLRLTTTTARRRGRGAGRDDENPLAVALSAASRQVAPVLQGQAAWELELDESEKRAQGEANFDGSVGTSGFSISPSRSVSRCHWPGLSSCTKRGSSPLSA